MATTVRTSGPHIENNDSVQKNMWEVAAALLPATVASVVFFGPYSLYLIFASAIGAALIERPFTYRTSTTRSPLGDGSAFLAGMLFGLTLSPGTPPWIPFFGAALVVLVGKLAFGGIGHNVFNPALVARGILLIGYPALVMEWRVPFEFDAVTAATPLSGGTATYLELFLGNIPGSIGEVSAVALLIGAVYLFVRGYVGWRISLSYLGAAMLTALVLGIDPVFTVLSGSIMFAALFMSTDMVTSPTGRTARIVYGIGCGVLTVLIREFTVYPAGVTFAVLFMNGVTPLIDVTFVDTFFGEVERRRRRIVAGTSVAAVIVLGVLIGFSADSVQSFAGSNFLDGTVRRDLSLFFSDADTVEPFESKQDGVVAYQVLAGGSDAGFILYSSQQGYKSEIKLVTALDTEERIIGLRVRDQKESATLGGLIRRPSFLNQFLRRSTADPEAVVDQLEAISGATASSRAVATALERALMFRAEPEAPEEGLTLSDGEYTGTGRGYGGPIEVRVVIEGQAFTEIEVLSHNETPGIGEPALAPMIESVIEKQSLDVDQRSGATATSRGILAAIENAVGQ